MNDKPAYSLPPGAEVLVTGATGFTGAVLMRKLGAMDIKLRAIARATSNLEPLAGLPVSWHRGDVFDPKVVAEATRGVQYIFHVAAAFREPGIADAVYSKVHVESTKLLAAAAREQPGFRRFVHVSTIGVHGHIDEPPANEESRFAPGDIYQRTKAEAELWFRDFAAREGLPFTVVRPCAIYGPGDRRLLKLFKMAIGPVYPMVGRGKCLYHLIHVDDLTDFFLHAATHPAALGEVFICGNARAIPMETMGRIIAETLGRKLHPLRLPAWPFFAAAAACEAICRPFGVNPPLYRRRVAFYTKDRSFDTSKMRERLQFECRWSDEEGLRQTALWYRDQGWLR